MTLALFPARAGAIRFFGTFALALAFSVSSPAQPPGIQSGLMTNVWQLIGKRTYRQNKARQMETVFPPALKALSNKVIDLPGYLIPIEIGMEFTVCYISVLPVEQCYFCGSNGIPGIVEVHLAKPIRYMERPVKVRGRLVLNESSDDRSEVFLVDAKLLKP